MGHVTQDISVSSRVTELLSLDYADKLHGSAGQEEAATIL
jgi:hypothetical protein